MLRPKPDSFCTDFPDRRSCGDRVFVFVFDGLALMAMQDFYLWVFSLRQEIKCQLSHMMRISLECLLALLHGRDLNSPFMSLYVQWF